MTPPTTKEAGFPLGTQASWSNSTFLERYDLSGKTSVLFATSGGSGFGRTADNPRNSVAADAAIIKGRVSRGHASEADLSVLAEMA